MKNEIETSSASQQSFIFSAKKRIYKFIRKERPLGGKERALILGAFWRPLFDRHLTLVWSWKLEVAFGLIQNGLD